MNRSAPSSSRSALRRFCRSTSQAVSLLLGAALVTACASAATPPPTAVPSKSPVVAASPTASAVPTQTPRPPTATPTPTLTATITSTSTDTPTPTSTATATPQPVINLLTNGGFEAGDLSGWENLGGITISPAAAFSGASGALMQSSGSIYQVFKTRVGATYQVSARIRIDEEIAAPAWGGVLVSVTSWEWQQLGAGPFLTAANAPLGQWTSLSFSFVAATDRSRLIFQNFSGGGQFRAAADAFAVTAK